MRSDIGDACTYLMDTWEKGDKVFIFGFSRGAYTARALCGMLLPDRGVVAGIGEPGSVCGAGVRAHAGQRFGSDAR